MAEPDKLRSLVLGSWRLDRTSPAPAYAQIEDRLVALIAAGDLGVGDRLPAERDLAEWVGVSRMTARAALRSLDQRGVVERGVGRGTFVARGKLDHDLTDFAGFTELVRRQGMAPDAQVRAATALPAPEHVAAALELEPGAPVLRVERVRFADDEPLTLEDSWIPADRFPGLLDRDLTGSLYELMGDAYDEAPVRAVERLEPVLAAEAEAQALGVSVGAPLMRVERVAYDAAGAPVEFAHDHHRGDRARFVVHVATSRVVAT
jgi:GntR family transcriptional regulator